MPHEVPDFMQCRLIGLRIVDGYRYWGVCTYEVAPAGVQSEVSLTQGRCEGTVQCACSVRASEASVRKELRACDRLVLRIPDNRAIR